MADSNAANDNNPAASPKSVPAIVTFWLLGLWTLTIISTFAIIFLKVQIEGTALGLLAGVIGTTTTLTVGAVGFWVGSSVGAKAAGDEMARQAKDAQAALGQLAGVGPQPPAPPQIAPDAAPAVVPEEAEIVSVSPADLDATPFKEVS